LRICDAAIAELNLMLIADAATDRQPMRIGARA
jgi:hypothetical protein